MRIGSPIDADLNDQLNDKGAAAMITTLLERFAPHRRRAIALRAVDNCAPTKIPVPPFFAPLSDSMSPEARQAMARKIAADALACMTAAPDATAAQIQDTGKTFLTGDPAGTNVHAGTAHTLASVLFNLAMFDPDFCKKMQEGGMDKALEAIGKYYDCHEHHTVLGGDPVHYEVVPISGGVLGDWLKGTWNNIKTSVKQALLPSVSQTAETISDAVSAATTPEPQMVTQQAMEQVSQAKSAMTKTLDELRAGMDQMIAKQKEFTNQAKQSAQMAARMTWAEAILNSDDKAAELLSMIQPDMATPQAIITTCFDLVNAAKQSGDTTAWSSLVSGLKAALSKGNISATAMSSFLSGDPTIGQYEPLNYEEQDGERSNASQLQDLLDGHTDAVGAAQAIKQSEAASETHWGMSPGFSTYASQDEKGGE